jgi:hypothetical protein
LSAILSVSRYALAGVQSSTTGYWGGGFAGSYYTDIDGITFSTEAATNPAAALVTARRELAGVYSTTKGYWAGGGITAYYSEITGFTFSTEAATTLAATLATARYGLAGTSASTTAKGYFAGGTTTGTTRTAEIDGIIFASDAATNPAATLISARYNVGSL